MKNPPGLERKFTQQNRFATREVIKNGQDEWETSAMHVIHGTMLASYIGATSRQLGGKKQISHDTKTIFYHADHLGSVRLITDSHGNVVDSNTTDAYGNPLPGATALPDTPPGSPKNKGAKMLSNFNFIGTHGIRYVEKVKLHNMRARWYKNKLSRFLSYDIVKTSNRFPYSNLNPLINIDPSGNVSIKVLVGFERAEFNTKHPTIKADFSSHTIVQEFWKETEAASQLKSAIQQYDYVIIATHGRVSDPSCVSYRGLWPREGHYYYGSLDLALLLKNTTNVKAKLLIADACCSGQPQSSFGLKEMKKLEGLTFLGYITYGYEIAPMMYPPPLKVIKGLINGQKLSDILKVWPPLEHKQHPLQWVVFPACKNPALDIDPFEKGDKNVVPHTNKTTSEILKMYRLSGY